MGNHRAISLLAATVHPISCFVWCIILLSLPISVRAQTGPRSGGDVALDWFRRADALANIRMPGSASFRMKVTFHAYPGIDFAKPGKSTILTGDGVYEETWLSPEKWRREITLGSYHAVEVRADGVRKFQATSDYEPSRVLMLLEALLNPIPRSLLQPELETGHTYWKVQESSLDNRSYIRINSQDREQNGQTYSFGYALLPDGILLRQDSEAGVMTSWQNDSSFSGKIVPGHITVGVIGRDLLTAEVAVEPLPPGTTVTQLADTPAEPCMTLRPVHDYEVKMPRLLSSGFFFGGNADRFAFQSVIDRHGVEREVEVLAAPDGSVARAVLPHIQKEAFQPATLDGSPCELAMKHLY
jgi:hypothetical protein